MELVKQFGIITDNVLLYEQAFTHTSYANETNTESYERLEYLGDAVLELIMSEYLFLSTKEEEGMMTKLRAHYVCESALFAYSTKLHFNEYLRLGKGESEHGGKYRASIVADIFEAFIGAMYLDQGFDFVKKFIHQYVVPMIENHEVNFFEDYKSMLQEYVQTDRRSLKYEVVKEDGPAHNREFTVEVKIDGIVYGVGKAKSKKEAEQVAAHNAIEKSVNLDGDH